MNIARKDAVPLGWPLEWPGIITYTVFFTVLAILAGTIGTLPGDRWISRILQRLHGEPWRVLWHLGNALGTSRWVAIVAVVALIATLILKRKQDAWFLGIAIVLRIAAMPLKTLVGSPRPTASQVHIVEPVSGYGFPSGHTLTATILFGTIAVLLVRQWSIAHPRITMLAILIWIGGVSLTGFARIWGGAHWASDVLGGALAGIVAIGIAASISRHLNASEGVSTTESPGAMSPACIATTSRETILKTVQDHMGSGK